MSTEYEILDRNGGLRLLLTERGSRVGLELEPFENARSALVFNLTSDELAKMAVEILKVASYLDPEAIRRTAQKIDEKPDWEYYHGVIRDLL